MQAGHSSPTDRISRRQQAFRADFRAKIARAYDGWLHVVMIYAIGGAAIWFAARQNKIDEEFGMAEDD